MPPEASAPSTAAATPIDIDALGATASITVVSPASARAAAVAASTTAGSTAGITTVARPSSTRASGSRRTDARTGRIGALMVSAAWAAAAISCELISRVRRRTSVPGSMAAARSVWAAIAAADCSSSALSSCVARTPGGAGIGSASAVSEIHAAVAAASPASAATAMPGGRSSPAPPATCSCTARTTAATRTASTVSSISDPTGIGCGSST
ncbi:MAG: hypothetical protein R2939_11040 [Kofleriaceae bacterium]